MQTHNIKVQIITVDLLVLFGDVTIATT